MEIRIDPSFPPAFERLRKGARKKSHQVRDALAQAARNGQGLPQKDKLTLPWKQQKRTVFWIRIDRAIRLMYEQDGDVQTVLYVGRHQEAESFLRNFSGKAPEEESMAIAEWLHRTAPPAASARNDKADKDGKPASTANAQRQLISALENLFEDCLLNLGPAVVEEYASPQVLDLERRFSELRDRFGETAKAEQRERAQLHVRHDELQNRATNLEQTLEAVKEQTAVLKDALAATAEDCRRRVREEAAAIRDSQVRDAAERLHQTQMTEARISALHQALTELQGAMRTRQDQALERCRADLAAIVESRLAGQDGKIDELRQAQEYAKQRLAAFEEAAAEPERRGFLERLWRGRRRRG